MRLVLFGPTYPFKGGISHYTTLLYHHLARYHQVTLFSFTRQYPRILFPGRSDRDPSRLVIKAPCQYTLDSLNPFTWFSTASQMAATGASWAILPWWVPLWGLHFFVMARLLRGHRMQVLYWCHNVAPHEARVADRYLTWLALSQGHAYVVHSPRDERLLQELFPQRPVYRTPLPVLNMFGSQVIEREEARRLLGLNVSKPIALFFGFVRPYKGLGYLLEALALVRQEMDVHLLIAGEFWESEEFYISQIKRLNLGQAVTVINRYIPNEEIPLYFAAADVVVLPYLETSQSAVMEMAHGFGKPTIVSCVAGMMDAARDRSDSLLVPPRDSSALAGAIRAFFEHYLATSIRPIDERDTSWQTMIRTIEMAMRQGDREQEHV